uniref:NADH-ubiquinone oxidoreductase chain 6 n=1 Tax=Nicrophorus nepalensis TaxID=307049 RepID=A0A8A5RA95_NICNE|nr:NADH dehydrogenase subunit 6 [Nicrophorus nepalensis]QTG39883.1 NADH dehydrogenase subunit 6 [Nicrophorus nepalensis]
MMIIMLSILTSMSFIFMNHPLTMSLILLIHAFTISITTGFLSINFWFSYILFMIMVGGMLVLFLYMTSIASNKKFKFNMNILIMNFIICIFSMIYFYMNKYSLIQKNYYIMETSISKYLSISKFMNFPFNLIMFVMIIYLFITLIAVVKITSLSYGPLRNKI